MDSLQSIFSSTWTIALAIIALGTSIFVHELGHFLAAKKRGMKVERFSIGFGPKIFAWTGKDGIEYRLSWFPFGGYVALPQLADMAAIEGESSTPVEKLPPISFSTKVIVAVAGPVFNVLFAILIATVLWATGRQVAAEAQTNEIGSVRTTVEVKDGKVVPGPAAVAGLKEGDTILAIDGTTVETMGQINEVITMGAGRNAAGDAEVTLTIKRNDRVFDVKVNPVYAAVNDFHRDIGIGIGVKVVASAVSADSPAAEAGLRPGDQLTHIDGNPIRNPSAIREYIAQTKQKPVAFTYIRDGKTTTLTITPRLTTAADTKTQAYLIGIAPTAMLTFVTIHTPPWTLINEMFKRTFSSMATLANPHSDVGVKDMRGPLGMVDEMRQAVEYDPMIAVWMLILINIALAVFNMLPIPVLDGGHILIAAITKIRGRALPTQVIATAQGICMVLLFSLMILVSFNDGRRILKRFFANPPPAAQQAPATPAAPAAPAPAK